jgi:hypothetical protein
LDLDSHLLPLKVKLDLSTFVKTVLFSKHFGDGHHKRATSFA